MSKEIKLDKQSAKALYAALGAANDAIVKSKKSSPKSTKDTKKK